MANDFPIVCVGGSAGGLDAYTRLLKNLPDDLGVAIVIVNHLRTVSTMLHRILPNYTSMPVELITERLDVRPNCVFIIPEKRDLHVLNGEFRLKPISKPRGWPDVITVFLRLLTDEKLRTRLVEEGHRTVREDFDVVNSAQLLRHKFGID